VNVLFVREVHSVFEFVDFLVLQLNLGITTSARVNNGIFAMPFVVTLQRSSRASITCRLTVIECGYLTKSR